MRILGWRLNYRHPEFQRYVLIVAPHTSNWDFILGLMANWALELKVSYMGKHSLFGPPLGWFFRATGGIPVNRDGRHDMIQQMAQRFADADRLLLALAPEGTRGPSDHWKSGFWHIARAARVPVVMAYIDYDRREMGGGAWFEPADEMESDFETIRGFYTPRKGRRPENAAEIRPRQRQSGA